MEVLPESDTLPPPKKPARVVAFELKGVTTSLAVLRLRSLDLGLIERQLRIKIAQLPHFFQDAPVILDWGAMQNVGAEAGLGELVKMLRGCRLIPVGVTNVNDDLRALAVAEGLGVMPYRSAGAEGSAAAAKSATPTPTAAAAPEPAAKTPVEGNAGGKLGADRPPLVIRQPVRGGQVIYAQRADLVVLAPVNPGAEVIADGNVHIYATLRGRAIAGAQGFAGAHIFCQRLEAELLAVGGAYVLADDIPAERHGLPAQIYLDQGECRISAL